MFDDLLKEIRKLEHQNLEISVPVEPDEKGYIDKQCPSEECEFIFKVNEEDWSNIFKDEAVWCPFCKYEAPANEWLTKEQVEHAQAEAMEMLKSRFSAAISSGVQKFNRKQPRNNFIKMSMNFESGHHRSYIMPIQAVEAMQLEIQCEECESRYAVIGSAYFCPACGHNSVLRTFEDSIRKITAKLKNLDIIRAALTESASKDEAELTCRSLVESSLSDGVVAFQRYCEELYKSYGEVPFNAFQRLDQGSKLWKAALGKSYGEILSIDEMNQLSVLFQKRHLLQHKDGLVDSIYIEKTDDHTYRSGQRIVVRESDVKLMITLINKLISGLYCCIQNEDCHGI